MHSVPIDDLTYEQRDQLLHYLLRQNPTAIDHLKERPSTYWGKKMLYAASDELSLDAGPECLEDSIGEAIASMKSDFTAVLLSTLADHCDAFAEGLGSDIMKNFEARLEAIWTAYKAEFVDSGIAQTGGSIHATLGHTFFEELEEFFQKELPIKLGEAVRIEVDSRAIQRLISRHFGSLIDYSVLPSFARAICDDEARFINVLPNAMPPKLNSLKAEGLNNG
ncbi:hypothetical protein [Octadecabacter sp. R77987]|uniref:hypothetical protein n=1 Tax=Octadecabacter sp. R77987 TaxID=3093874 RepID=UPI00366B5C3C